MIRELLTDADWVLWGSLNGLLPTMAEAAPGEFLDVVEKAMRMTLCPFDELFSQEGNGITGGNYLTGLLWALEGLAWDEKYLVRVFVALGELASHDPGGQWANRPSNSLATILLPWLPQTLASVEKRKVTVRTILNEWLGIAWNLIIQLLPGQHQTSSGSHKPSWRKIIPEFFSEVIRLIYRSKKEVQSPKEPTEDTNAWRLLHEWKTVPGTQENGTFSEERFTEWLKRVKEICTESGHLEVALINIGEVLISHYTRSRRLMDTPRCCCRTE